MFGIFVSVLVAGAQISPIPFVGKYYHDLIKADPSYSIDNPVFQSSDGVEDKGQFIKVPGRKIVFFYSCTAGSCGDESNNLLIDAVTHRIYLEHWSNGHRSVLIPDDTLLDVARKYCVDGGCGEQ